jgi:hypothetical protein
VEAAVLGELAVLGGLDLPAAEPSTLSTMAEVLRSSSCERPRIMSFVNWWIRKSFCGSRYLRVSDESHWDVRLTSSALTEPIACPGIWPWGMRHSGSSAKPTSGSLSQRRSALASVRKSDVPGWMSSSSRPFALRAAR